MFFPLRGERILYIFLIFPNHWSIISGSVIPLATIRQIIETGETDANLDEKKWSALLKFQISSENFDSDYGHDSNRNSISMWHYNQQDRFVAESFPIQGENTNVSALQLILPITSSKRL